MQMLINWHQTIYHVCLTYFLVLNTTLPFFSRPLITERYRVDPVSQDSREDCYLSTLHIADVDLHDSRPYYLVVDNERGIDRHAINLIVEGMFTGAIHFI